MNTFTRKGFLCVLCAVVLVVAAFGVSCKEEPQDRTATVTFIVGNVMMTGPDGKAAAVEVKDTLKKGFSIETGDNSLATIQVNGVGVVRILEKSKAVLKDILSSKAGTTLVLRTGKVFSRILKGRGTQYSVKTTTMVAAVRGTEFLTVSGDGGSNVLVREGTVSVSSDADRSGKDVTAKRIARVDEGGQIALNNQNRIQELTLEKLALHPYIENVEKKSAGEIAQAFHTVNTEEKRIDAEIIKASNENTGPDLSRLSPLDRLRKQGKQLMKFYLKDGSQLIGAVEKSTASVVSLNTGESIINIPKTDIKRRFPTK